MIPTYRIAIKEGKQTKYQAIAQCRHHVFLFITFWTNEKIYAGNKLLDLVRENKSDWDKRFGNPELVNLCKSEL